MKIYIHDMISPYLSLINIPLKIKFGQMLNQFKGFISRSPPARPQLPPPCNHPYCACTHQAYCLKTLGEETISLSDVHSINTLISDHFSGHEVEYGWDSDEGWFEFCHRCHQERCQDCQSGDLTIVTNFEDVLTYETREAWICSPCKHRRCPGWKLNIVSACAKCGHEVCAECMVRGDEKRGLFCCRCTGQKNLVNCLGASSTETQKTGNEESGFAKDILS
jgi:hypothetical protein